jgi:hypothetical protein
MKKYLATGLVAIIPALVVLWLVTVFINFVTAVVGTYSLWNVVVGLLVALAGILGLGFALVHSKLVRNVRNWLEESDCRTNSVSQNGVCTLRSSSQAKPLNKRDTNK